MANLAARNSAARLPVPLVAAPAASSPPTPSADDFGRPVAGPISLCVTNPAAPRPRSEWELLHEFSYKERRKGLPCGNAGGRPVEF